MRVINKRWGEVSIKKQGKQKNDFDKTKSFSIENSKYEYTIGELKEIFEAVTNLTERYSFLDLKKLLLELNVGLAAEVKKDVVKQD